MKNPLPDPWNMLDLTAPEIARHLGLPARSVFEWVHSRRRPNAAAQKLILALFAARNLEPPKW